MCCTTTIKKKERKTIKNGCMEDRKKGVYVYVCVTRMTLITTEEHRWWWQWI
jgi:hypothetical protein